MSDEVRFWYPPGAGTHHGGGMPLCDLGCWSACLHRRKLTPLRLLLAISEGDLVLSTVQLVSGAMPQGDGQ